MNCTYPNCRNKPLYHPVVSIPTLRTVGVHKPVLSPLVHDLAAMHKFGLSQGKAIQQHEEQVTYYMDMVNRMVETTEPTYLIGQPICEQHKATYKLTDWIKESDWGYLRQAAAHFGLMLPEAALVIITFKPLGWTPGRKGIELTR